MTNQQDNKREITADREKCCAKCKYFEERTCFCRCNPPTPIMTETNGQKYVTSVFSKVLFPLIDWCRFFEKNS